MNIPQQLKEQGTIDHVAYSLYLNAENSTGTILFGGVDHSKYSGSLQLLPLVQQLQVLQDDFPAPLGFNVVLNAITATASGGQHFEVMSEGMFPALLDSGTTAIVLPAPLAMIIANAVQATPLEDSETFIAVCDLGIGVSLSFDLSGATIEVPLSEVMAPFVNQTSGTQIVEDGYSVCLLNIETTDQDQIILGDAFLRSAYVVFDLENYEVAIAQASYDNSNSNIESIGSSIPSATPAARYSSTSINGNYSTGTSSVFNPPSSVPALSSTFSSALAATSVKTARVGASGTSTVVASGTGSTTSAVASATTSAAASATATKKTSGASSSALCNPIAAIAVAFASFIFM
jgi:yapsin 1